MRGAVLRANARFREGPAASHISSNNAKPNRPVLWPCMLHTAGGIGSIPFVQFQGARLLAQFYCCATCIKKEVQCTARYGFLRVAGLLFQHFQATSISLRSTLKCDFNH